jgi:hypothetical protein
LEGRWVQKFPTSIKIQPRPLSVTAASIAVITAAVQPSPALAPLLLLPAAANAFVRRSASSPITATVALALAMAL